MPHKNNLEQKEVDYSKRISSLRSKYENEDKFDKDFEEEPNYARSFRK